MLLVCVMLMVATAGGAFADSFQIKNNQHSVNNANNSTDTTQTTCQASQLAINCFGGGGIIGGGGGGGDTTN